MSGSLFTVYAFLKYKTYNESLTLNYSSVTLTTHGSENSESHSIWPNENLSQTTEEQTGFELLFLLFWQTQTTAVSSNAEDSRVLNTEIPRSSCRHCHPASVICSVMSFQFVRQLHISFESCTQDTAFPAEMLYFPSTSLFCHMANTLFFLLHVQIWGIKGKKIHISTIIG